MTDERTFDRLAGAWLDLGPDEAPDRVIAAVLQAAETTPQVRRPLRLPHWRSYPMSRTPIVAAVAAAIVVVIGGGLLITRSNEPSGNATPDATPTSSAASPAPSAIPSASGSAAAVAVPADLQSTWIGPKLTISGLPANDRFRFTLTDSLLQFPNDQLTDAALISAASAPTDDQLALASSETAGGCTKGDAGHYTWSLSPGGIRLTLSAIDDACANRSAALAGEWTRIACTNTQDACVGTLEAGTFASQYFTPRLPAGATWKPDWGALTYAVPGNWANSADWPNTFILTPSADYAKEGPDGPADGSANEVDVYRLPRATGESAPCDQQTIASPSNTVTGLAVYVTKLKGIVSTAPAAIELGGHAARWIDIRLASTSQNACSKDPNRAPSMTLFSHPDPNLNSYTVGISGREKERLIFVDLGGGAVALVVIDSADPARFDDLVAQAMPIIATFTFK